MKSLGLLLIGVVLTGAAGGGYNALTLTFDANGHLWAEPSGDALASRNNALWSGWHDQTVPTPPLVEGMATLYAWSELSYGQVALRAADFEQAYARGVAQRSPWTERLLRLRGTSIKGYRQRLQAEGFDCVVATKSDDIGREGLLWLYDPATTRWTTPEHVLVLDAASGDAWGHLEPMSNRLRGVWLSWVLEVAKDCLEQRGLERFSENNWSPFVRLALDDAQGRIIHWPETGGRS